MTTSEFSAQPPRGMGRPTHPAYSTLPRESCCPQRQPPTTPAENPGHTQNPSLKQEAPLHKRREMTPLQTTGPKQTNPGEYWPTPDRMHLTIPSDPAHTTSETPSSRRPTVHQVRSSREQSSHRTRTDSTSKSQLHLRTHRKGLIRSKTLGTMYKETRGDLTEPSSKPQTAPLRTELLLQTPRTSALIQELRKPGKS